MSNSTSSQSHTTTTITASLSPKQPFLSVQNSCNLAAKRIPFPRSFIWPLAIAFILATCTADASGANARAGRHAWSERPSAAEAKYSLLRNTTAASPLFAAAVDLANKDRPPECPPCFNCMLDDFPCLQYSECSPSNGRCICPTGFGGEDCSKPVCGALSDGLERPIRQGTHCDCKDGWDGINCNVCTKDSACDPLMPANLNGTCYRGGLTVNNNYQQCDVKNPKIVAMLPDQPPQVTFSCARVDRKCDFQFWAGELESFYCTLDDCEFKMTSTFDANITTYACPKIKCSCITGEFLCGKDGSIDISDFLTEEINGPGKFTCDTASGCRFEEPAMNTLIKDVFGDEYIQLGCNSGECVHYTEIPGFVRPPPPDRTVAIVVGVSIVAAFLLATVLGSICLIRKSRRDTASYKPLATSDDNDFGKLMDDHIAADLMFHRVSYWVGGKRVLHDICGNVKPGQVMAIMGASGAGKTSFLDILARRTKQGEVSGDFYVNGAQVEKADFKRVVGYVDQEDTLLPTLTVYETIMYSALLRLPRDMSDESKNLRVRQTMEELGIMKIKDHRIGESGSRGISGGEKRRVSIACELVTSPSILFLDEPTSGLDAYNAYNVVESLVTLARDYNRTVICTIHQPRSNIYALFDQLLLLASGRLVYSGSAKGVQAHFESIGHTCPPGFNIADFAVDLTMHAISHDDDENAEDSDDRDEANVVAGGTVGDEERRIETSRSSKGKQRPGRGRMRSRSTVKDTQEHLLYHRSAATSPSKNASTSDAPVTYWENDLAVERREAAEGTITPHLQMLVDGFKDSSIAQALNAEIDEIESRAGPTAIDTLIISPGLQKCSWLTQFRLLSDRTMKNLYRNPALLLTHYFISIVIALTCGLLFFRVTNDISGFQNRMGVMFFLCALLGFGCLTSLQVLASERILFVRERANGYYSPFTYFASKVLFDIIPLRVIPPLLLGIIIYPMVGLDAELMNLAKFLLVLVLFNLTAAAVCLFIGIVFKDLGVASLVSSLVMLFSMLFGGLLLNKDSLPKSMQWAKEASFFHSAFEAMMVNEMVHLQLTEKKYGLEIDVPGATILSTFGLDAASYWPDVVKLLFTFLLFVTASFIWLQIYVKEKR